LLGLKITLLLIGHEITLGLKWRSVLIAKWIRLNWVLGLWIID